MVAASAKWENHKNLPLHSNHIYHPTPHGIPQGSAASTVVAEWSISQLKWIEDPDVALINYADNFFLFAKHSDKLKSALEALRSAITELPGGVFKVKPDEGKPGTIRHVFQGFDMLGCSIKLTNDGLDVEPTKTAYQELRGRFWLEAHVVEALLTTAHQEQDSTLRFEGVQAFLRLRSYVQSWMAAHTVCTDIGVIEDDIKYQLDYIAFLYSLDEAELKAATDSSTEAKYYASSKSSVYAP